MSAKPAIHPQMSVDPCRGAGQPARHRASLLEYSVIRASVSLARVADLQALDESSLELAPARSGQGEERVVAQTTRVSLAALGIFNYSLREPFSRSFCLAACETYSGFLEGPPSLVVCGR
jgi:hypothetical protein